VTVGALARSWEVVAQRAWSLGRGMVPPGRGKTAGLLPTPSDWGNPAGPFVWGPESARRIPSVARCLGLYGGLVKQMKMRAYRGGQALPQPPLLDAPDPTRGGPWFVQAQVEDYLLSGNAISYVTARGADGWPLACVWLPAPAVSVMWTPPDFNEVDYFYNGAALRRDDVIHVRRGADRYYPVRGVGVVEDALATLNRIAAEEEYEAGALASSAVPSVAIIAPGTLTPDTAEAAKTSWMDTFSGPIREPVILPSGTVVQPLAWSPSDAQLTESRHMSLIDMANFFNLDAYWLSGPAQGLTYKNPSQQYQQILRTSLEPVLADFEAVWSKAWLPRGTSVQFGREQLLREDLATTATAGVALVGAGIWSKPEARDALDMPDPNNVPKPPKPPPAPAVPSPPAQPAPADTTGGEPPP
jgi:HK97 family phage portal protein